MNLTYHLTERIHYETLDARSDYVPAAFGEDGYIHCTDAPEEMARIANLSYGSQRAGHFYLYIDKDRVRAPVRYDDAERKYPHIYGPLNRDAIIAVRPAGRDAAGKFLPPEPL